jgi:hypothetical protein
VQTLLSDRVELTLLGPTTPYASVEHGNFKYVGYTGVFNVVDYSAVSFPSGVIADKEKDQVPSDYTPLSDICKETHSDCKLKDRLFETSANLRRQRGHSPWYAC